jgi:hypothetical protein
MNEHDRSLALRRITGDAHRQQLAQNEALTRDLSIHGRRFPMTKVRVKVEFSLGFGRIAQVGEIVEVKSDDAAWLCASSIAWAETV